MSPRANAAVTRKWNHPRLLALVALGGAVGSLLRFAVASVFRPEISFLGTLIVNIVGSFLLGFLLEALTRRGPETVRSKQVRLLIGTGICGGFTTYSTFALDLQQRLAIALAAPSAANLSIVLGYLLGTLIIGTAAALLGVWLASRIHQSPAVRFPSGATPSQAIGTLLPPSSPDAWPSKSDAKQAR